MWGKEKVEEQNVDYKNLATRLKNFII